MNTTASFSSEPSWSRRCSTETIFSIQGKETDFVRDTSDTDWFDSDGEAGVEYEPASGPDDEGPLSGASSGHSDNEIIATKVIEISVGDDGELQLADSELTASSSDSEMDLHDYWLCAHCRAQNNNPMYRYCEKCFKERKNFFPPRPKRKRKRELSTQRTIEPEPLPRTLSQDSGVESVANSQELSQRDLGHNSQSSVTESVAPKSFETSTPGNTFIKKHLKRRAESADRRAKRFKIDYSDSESDTDSDSSRNSKCNVKLNETCNIKTEISVERTLAESKAVSDSETNIDRNKLMLKNNIETRSVATMVSDSEFNNDRSKSIFSSDLQVKPLVKMVSDPALTVENTDVKLIKKVIVNTIKEKLDIESKDLCIVCSVEPKSGVFVHGRIAHICCCYECAVKVWFKAKRCPVCNMKVSNVLKAVVM